MSTIISPSSLLLSATGTLAFKNCALSDQVTTFTAPEMLQGRASSTKPAMEKVPLPVHTRLNYRRSVLQLLSIDKLLHSHSQLYQELSLLLLASTDSGKKHYLDCTDSPT